jgi:hypothetical protein
MRLALISETVSSGNRVATGGRPVSCTVTSNRRGGGAGGAQQASTKTAAFTFRFTCVRVYSDPLSHIPAAPAMRQFCDWRMTRW